MQEEKQEPYFYNPGMSSEQLEDWLNQQCLYVAHYNRLLKEKTALNERLKAISAEIECMTTGNFDGTQSFPWDPSPLAGSHQ